MFVHAPIGLPRHLATSSDRGFFAAYAHPRRHGRSLRALAALYASRASQCRPIAPTMPPDEPAPVPGSDCAALDPLFAYAHAPYGNSLARRNLRHPLAYSSRLAGFMPADQSYRPS